MTGPQQKAEEAASMAIEKTADAQEAIEASRKAQNEASDAKHLDMMIKALRVVFPEVAHLPDDQMKIYLPRVPLICKSIMTIEDTLKEMSGRIVSKAEFELIKRLVFGAVALILIAFVGVLVALTFKKV